jgi:exoribonuclease R
MPKYTTVINDRNYTSWSYLNSSGETVDLASINPLEHHLLNEDVFTVDKHDKVEIVDSPNRNGYIPAVLLLSNNKTYGRHPKNNKLLYKCVPDNVRLPSFLVPYEIKKVGFSKIQLNQYVVLEFTEWSKKHPTATLHQTIGPVDQNQNFYEYQLYCKNLQCPSVRKLNNYVNTYLKTTTESECIAEVDANLLDRTTSHCVFSVDPDSSVDFDDAFSIQTNELLGHTTMSIYISNVVVWLEYFDLWNSLGDRVSTIYLPDSKRPMLPAILSDHLCSLKEKETRFAFTMDIVMDSKNLDILDIAFTNTKIRVSKNYRYEEPALLKSKEYVLLEKMTRQISGKPGFGYIDSGITDSHDVVAYWMIFMNYHCAKRLLDEKQGLFRSTITKQFVMPPHLEMPEKVAKFIKLTNSFTGKYTCLRENESIEHAVLQMDAYVHITSPIRRIADILNMIKIQEILGLLTNAKEGALGFYNRWIVDYGVDGINAQMKAIRNVQMDCNMLHLCSTNPELLEKTHTGYAYRRKELDSGLLRFQYTVYLSDLNICSTLYSDEELAEYSAGKYKLYVFNNEEKKKKKIRIQKVC